MRISLSRVYQGGSVRKALMVAAVTAGLLFVPGGTGIASAAEPKVTPEQGPTSGGTLTTITGEFHSVKQVALGMKHSLALMSDGTLYATGDNSHGALGDGTKESSPAWKKIDLSQTALKGKTITQIDASARCSFALTSENRLYSWGLGGSALGSGNEEDVLVPTEIDMSGVLAGKKIMQVSAGLINVLVMADDGNVYSWGYNFWGSVGDGTRTDRSSPVAIDTSGYLSGKKVVQIESGDNANGYVVTADGSIFSWGYHGLIGNTDEDVTGILVANGGFDQVVSPIPVNQDAMSGEKVVKVFGGQRNSFALTENNHWYVWGAQNSGSLGNGSGGGPAAMHPVRTLDNGPLAGKNVVDFASGEYYSMALLDDGTVYGWGDNIYGKLGLGVAPPYQSDPHVKPVKLGTAADFGNKKVVEIKTFLTRSLVRTEDGTVYAWGDYTESGIGNGEKGKIEYTPVRVHAPSASVRFDGVPATNVRVLSETSVQASTPAHASGVVDVVVSFNGTATTIEQGYTYGLAPEITQHPETVTLSEDFQEDDATVATFDSLAVGDESPVAQWQKSTDEGKTWADIAGEKSESLEVPVVADNIGAQFRAVFTNGLGQAVSEPASIVSSSSTPIPTPTATASPTVAPTTPTTTVSPTTPATTVAPTVPAASDDSNGGLAMTGPAGIALAIALALAALGGGLLLRRAVLVRR